MDVRQYEDKMKQALEHFNDELKKVRTGRAHASMLDGVTVVAYGSPMPLNQVANVTAPEAQLLQITPFDPNNIQAIASAIRDNPSLGMNPMDDGRVVRVPVPPLNEERRRELVKVLGGKLEDCMIALRNIRHDAMDAIAAAKKDKSVGEDDAKRLEKQIDDAMNKSKTEAEAAQKAREADVMTV
ncbi:MAG TPA: ribosome recycling factor [Candidatus Saccharimonadales bacterium]